MSKLLAALLGMVVGAGLFATGVATGTAYATRHQDECDEPEASHYAREHHLAGAFSERRSTTSLQSENANY